MEKDRIPPVAYHYVVTDIIVRSVPKRPAVEHWMESVLRTMKATVLARSFGDFPVVGWTSVWILAESHALIHASPENGWIEIVFAFCSPLDAEWLKKRIQEFFLVKSLRQSSFVGSAPEVPSA